MAVTPEVCTRSLGAFLAEVRKAMNLNGASALALIEMRDIVECLEELEHKVAAEGWTAYNRDLAGFVVMDCSREVLLKDSSCNDALQAMMRFYVFVKLLPPACCNRVW